MKKHILYTILTISLALNLVACDTLQSLVPTKAVVESGTLLFSDNFSVTPNGWGTMGREGGDVGFEYQGMVITVNIPHYMFWSVNGGNYSDVRVEVDAVLLDGPANDNFGIICRYQDADNFYGFVISHDGYYGIFKMIDGQMVLSTPDGNLVYSDTIRQGGVVNHLLVVCKSNTLSLAVNDALLSQVVDESFTQGQIGLLASAYDYPGVKVLFDNLEAYQP